MAIDFRLTPELEDIRVRVRGFVADVVKPGEDEIAATTGLSRQDYLRILPTDTPLASMYQHARWARFADGADEVHQMRIAQRTIAAYTDTGSTRSATGDLPL